MSCASHLRSGTRWLESPEKRKERGAVGGGQGVERVDGERRLGARVSVRGDGCGEVRGAAVVKVVGEKAQPDERRGAPFALGRGAVDDAVCQGRPHVVQEQVRV